MQHYKFRDTPRFPALYKRIKDTAIYYAKQAQQTDDIDETLVTLPILKFTGSEKLHGENMAVCYSNGELWVQGRNRINTIEKDQNGMALYLETHKSVWLTIFEKLIKKYSINKATRAIVIDCEWAGGNIQKGNAACSDTPKAAYIFDYFRVINSEGNETLYPFDIAIESDDIYIMSHFGTYEVVLDFNHSKECEETLAAIVEGVENNSPIAKYFCKENNVGEGVYFTCTATDEHPFYFFKVKGEKHGGKPKQKREQPALTSEKIAQLTALAEQLTPVWRITQGITETSATSMKDIGNLFKWINQDIIKEELHVLVDAGFEFKQVQKYITQIVKDYFINYLNDY